MIHPGITWVLQSTAESNQKVQQQVPRLPQLQNYRIKIKKIPKLLTRDLRSKPLHDMNWGFDQLQRQLHQHRHAKATRAYATQQQPIHTTN